MLKSASLIAALTLIYSCLGRNDTPEHIRKIINYFDSNRIKEFETVSFFKQVHWGNNLWVVGDSNSIFYEYNIAFASEDHFASRLHSDTLPVIIIHNNGAFQSKFPWSISLPEATAYMILRKDSVVDCDVNMNKNSTSLSVKQYTLFPRLDPFAYFASRTRTMDSLGVSGIKENVGDLVTIRLNSAEEYLDYIPNDLSVDDLDLRVVDSIISAGYRINKNWVWRKYDWSGKPLLRLR